MEPRREKAALGAQETGKPPHFPSHARSGKGSGPGEQLVPYHNGVICLCNIYKHQFFPDPLCGCSGRNSLLGY